MGESTFHTEDKVGLAAAIVLHFLLAAALALQVFFTPFSRSGGERVTVNLATEVSLESTAPDPVDESRAAIAPTLSDRSAPEANEPVTEARPEAPVPPPPPARTNARPTSRAPAPNRDRSRPDRQPERAVSSSNAGGSRIGNDFLEGQGSSTRTDDTRIPASEIGASARASLQQAINRQIKPHWSAPPGLDAEQLVTIVAFRLNPDGSLAGRPRVVSQSGINDANRAQASTHADNAVRAVQRAAPFDLPEEYYEVWKNITAWRFDRRL